MEETLKEYSEIIEQLKPYCNTPDFDQAANELAGYVPKPALFQIKMEMRRLAQVTRHPIDLRGKVPGNTQAFEYEGVVHHLDYTAQQVFEQQIELFNGYTIGVLEAVMNTENSYKYLQQKEKEAKIANKSGKAEEKADTKPVLRDHEVNQITFAQTLKRREERMNFASSIEMITTDTTSISANSVDLSVGGMCVKTINEYPIKPGFKVRVFLRALETEYAFKAENGIPYKVAWVRHMDKTHFIGLQRNEEETTEETTAFLKKFVQGYKRRYKVNIENTIYAVRFKLYEQYQALTMASVPAFLAPVEDELHAKYVLETEHNKKIISFWRDENDQACFSNLLTPERVKSALAKENPSFLAFCFKQRKNERMFFCSATMEELNQNSSILNSFFAIGARKPSWRIYLVQVAELNPKQSHIELTIPASLGEKARKLNMPTPARLQCQLDDLNYLSLITDITDKSTTEQLRELPLNPNDASDITKFVSPAIKLEQLTSVYPMRFQEQRREPRFAHKTQVVVTAGGKNYAGHSLDVSTMGMALLTNDPVPAESMEQIAISLPTLQAKTSNFNLKKMPYQIRHISADHKRIHLMAVLNKSDEPPSHTGKSFFNELFRQNWDKFTLKATEDSSGFSKALRNLLAHNVFNPTLMLQKHGSKIAPSTMVRANIANQLSQYFKDPQDRWDVASVLPLGGVKTQHTWLIDCAKSIDIPGGMVEKELLIRFDSENPTDLNAYTVKTHDDLLSLENRYDFVADTPEEQEFIALKLHIVRTDKPDPEALKAELSYVQVYAPHRANDLETELKEQFAVIHILDITEEVLLRFGLSYSTGYEGEEG